MLAGDETEPGVAGSTAKSATATEDYSSNDRQFFVRPFESILLDVAVIVNGPEPEAILYYTGDQFISYTLYFFRMTATNFALIQTFWTLRRYQNL